MFSNSNLEKKKKVVKMLRKTLYFSAFVLYWFISVRFTVDLLKNIYVQNRLGTHL